MTTEDSAPDASLAAGTGPLAALAAFIVYTLFALSVALVPIRSDNDCWWHVKTGQYIAQNGLPKFDVFSHTAADHEWHNHEWISQLAFYGAYRAGEATGIGGWVGVVLFTGAMVWLAYGILFFLAARISGNWWIALLIAAMAVAIGRRTFYPRPPVISNVILAGQLFLFVAIGEGWLRRGWAFLLVPVIALWTNLHGAWMAGGVILAAFAADQALCLYKHKIPRTPFAVPAQVLSLRSLMLLLPLCLLATLCNPYGWRLYELPARVLGDAALVQAIGELRPPDLYFVIDFEMALHGAFLLALVATGFRPRLWEVLVWLFFLHQAMQHVRHMLLFSVMMVPLYARLAAHVMETARASLTEWAGSARARVVLLPNLAALLIGVYFAGWAWINPREGGRIAHVFDAGAPPATYIRRNVQLLQGTGYIRERFPARACDFIELAELEGKMFNENNYAGYLIWRLSPEQHLVFSDPRFDIFGGVIWRTEEAISRGIEGWQALLDEHDVQWLITRSTTGLAMRLNMQEEPQAWVPAALWDDFEIWIRNTPENEAMIRRARGAAVLAGAHTPAVSTQ